MASHDIPSIDLSHPDAQSQLLKACEGLGFFKLINHGVPFDFTADLESQALKFFSLPLSDKRKAGPPNPLGYGNNHIGCRGDSGFLEYLLLTIDAGSIHHQLSSICGHAAADKFRCAVKKYVTTVKEMACRILEMLAEGLKIEQSDVFSKLLMDEQSDSIFRVNHYPPQPNSGGQCKIGFGEHTDPQMISILRSNDSPGFQILSKGGDWISVHPDQHSFFINIGDTLQVMSNGRFKSVRHRVVANSTESRVSMIYFGAPPLCEKIAPLPSLVGGDEDSLYKEFTWSEYKKSIYNSRLADNRLCLFQKTAISS